MSDRRSEYREGYRSLPDKMMPETSTRENMEIRLRKLLGLLTTDVPELVTYLWNDLDNEQKKNKNSEEQEIEITNLKKANEDLQNKIGMLKQKAFEETNTIRHKHKISELEKQVADEKRARMEMEKSYEEERKSSVKTYQDKLSMLLKTIEQQKNEIEKEKRRSKDDLVNRDDQLVNKRLSEQYDNLEKKLLKTERELKTTQDELEYTKTRLSKSMGDKLTDNNPNIADLSDRNRPTKLGERFQEIYDNEWTDAFETIGSDRDDEEKVVSVLVSILMDTKKFCDKEAEDHMKKIQSTLIQEPNSVSTALPVNVKEQLKEIRKCVAEYTDEHIYKRYQEELRYSLSSTARKAKLVPKYLEACFKVCWLMSIQDPPVVFGPDIKTGDEFNTDLYKAYTKSEKKVAYVVWPALLLHTGGPVLCKGVAQGLKDTTLRPKSAPPETGEREMEFKDEERNLKGHVNDTNAFDLEQNDGYLRNECKHARKYGTGTQVYDSDMNDYEASSEGYYRPGTEENQHRHRGIEQGHLYHISVDLRYDVGNFYERGNAAKHFELKSNTREYLSETKHVRSGDQSYNSNYGSATAYRTPDYSRNDYETHLDAGHRSKAYDQMYVSRPSRDTQKNTHRRVVRPVWKI